MAKKDDKDKKRKDKLPFAVFIRPKSNVGDTGDFKQVFTDIISDRIQEKFANFKKKQNLQNARKCGIVNIMAIAMLKPL